MAQEIYRANHLKWLGRNFKVLLVFALLTVGSWWIFDSSHDIYFLFLSVTLAVLGLGTFIAGFLSRPKLVMDGEGLKFGRAAMKFSDVVNVTRNKDEYTFFLASRRRVTVSLAEFSAEDKKEIDKILARRCLEHLSTGEAKDKIADAGQTAGLEFRFTAKRSRLFFAVYLLVWIFGGITLVACTALLVFGKLNDSAPMALVFLITLCLCVAAYILEMKTAKDVFSYREDTFSLLHRNKVKFSFSRADVLGVGINPNGQPSIFFRLKGNNKKPHVLLTLYRRRDASEMKEKIRSIFFLPEAEKTNPVFKNPFKF